MATRRCPTRSWRRSEPGRTRAARLGVRPEDRVLLALSDGLSSSRAGTPRSRSAPSSPRPTRSCRPRTTPTTSLHPGPGGDRRRDYARTRARGRRGLAPAPAMLVVGRGRAGGDLVRGRGRRGSDALEPAAHARTTWRSGSSRPAAPARRRRPATSCTTPCLARELRGDVLGYARTTSCCPFRSSSSATRATRPRSSRSGSGVRDRLSGALDPRAALRADRASPSRRSSCRCRR